MFYLSCWQLGTNGHRQKYFTWEAAKDAIFCFVTIPLRQEDLSREKHLDNQIRFGFSAGMLTACLHKYSPEQTWDSWPEEECFLNGSSQICCKEQRSSEERKSVQSVIKSFSRKPCWLQSFSTARSKVFTVYKRYLQEFTAISGRFPTIRNNQHILGCCNVRGIHLLYCKVSVIF